MIEIVNQRFGDLVSLREPFAGSAALTLGREPVKREALNDVNHYIVNFWRAVQGDPEAVAHHATSIVSEADLHSRSTYLFQGEKAKGACHRIASDPEFYDTRLAGWYAWGRSCQIGNSFEVCNKSRQAFGGAGVCSLKYRTLRAKQLAILDRFIAISDRIHNINVTYGDWSRLVRSNTALGLKGHGKSVAGVFLDPPYARDINRLQQLLGIETVVDSEYSGRMDCYLCDSDKDQVNRLVADVNTWCQKSGENPRLRIALCGYSGEHDNLLQLGWKRHSWTTQGGFANMGSKSSRGNKNKKLETIWFSPHCIF